MKTQLGQFLDFLLFSNIFIALGAVAQGLVTYGLLNARPDACVLALLFCSTLAQYNFSILLSKPAHPDQSPFRRVRWIFSHERLTLSLTFLTTAALMALFFALSHAAQILLALLAALSMAYALPLFKANGKKFGLRNIPGIKLFLIATVWSLSCVVLPVLELEARRVVTVPVRDIFLLTAKRFLLVAAITVPFDIRDLFQDRSNALRTIPVILGEKKANLFCQALLLIYLILLFLFTQQFNADFVGLALTAVLAGWLIFKSNWKRNEYYYFFYLDGVLILQWLAMAVARGISHAM
jgi:4-hydroxybenzoate polyprenyltransferase